MAHGTAVLNHIVLPWANSQQGVWADSYFCFTFKCRRDMQICLCFIGVVKTATKKYLMVYLTRIKLNEGRVQCVGVVLKNQNRSIMLTYVWNHN